MLEYHVTEKCIRSHLLEPPNLVDPTRRKHYETRNCLACSRASGEINYAKARGIILKEGIKKISDRKYQEIMVG